jgi:CHRD domain-containing protein
MRKKAPLLIAALALLALGVLHPAAANPSLDTTLSGAAEINGGDPDGSGEALISLSPGGNELCFKITVSNLSPAIGAHIHQAPVGVNGPIVVTLTAPGADGTSIGCVPVDAKLLKDIQQHPDQYYVNVHTTEYPNGAIRGQLSK